jgi:antirestriction protein ArdC
MVCGVLGIAPVKVEAIASDGDEEILESSAAYLNSWINVLKADTRPVVIAAARAQRAADFILGRHQLEEDRARDESA